ncbi:MAG: ABC transporter permease [Lachnospiraceae bacterium]|nr:ABC transporter permease [Lachnospiraceae bacterium]
MKQEAVNETQPKRVSMFYTTMKRLAKNKVAMAGLIILIILVLLSVFAPLIAPYEPGAMDYSAMYATPSLKHLFGCDGLGRDIFSRLLYGGRYSLALGFIAALVGMVFGVFFGILIGYAGGKVDMICMRIVDVIEAIPGQLLAILISTALGPGLVNTIIALSVGAIPGVTRNNRAMCLKEREMEYLESAKSINCSPMKIMFKHMMPNIISPTIVGTTMGIGMTIMSAAGLSYIGLGIQPPTPEWGAMLAAGREYILLYPHMLIFPGLFIAITVLSINMFGDGLRDAMDPKLKD